MTISRFNWALALAGVMAMLAPAASAGDRHRADWSAPSIEKRVYDRRVSRHRAPAPRYYPRHERSYARAYSNHYRHGHSGRADLGSFVGGVIVGALVNEIADRRSSTVTVVQQVPAIETLRAADGICYSVHYEHGERVLREAPSSACY